MIRNILIVACVLVSCSPRITDISARSVKEIENTDKEMSSLASKIGFNKALLEYADKDVVKPSDGHFSLIGKESLAKAWGDKEGPKTLSWSPYKSEAARSGDLGYSLGHWTLVAKDTTLYGDYITFWKRQSDGKWKFVMDAGNGTPKPH